MKARHRVGAFVLDGAFQLIGALQGTGFRFPPEGAAVAIGGFDVRRVEKERVVVLAASRVAAQRQAPVVFPWKLGPAADHLVLVGLSRFPPVLADHLDGRFHRFRAAGKEIDAVEGRIGGPCAPAARRIPGPLRW